MSEGCGIVDPDAPEPSEKKRWYMNEKPQREGMYEPTPHEHCANILTHGIAILPSLIIMQVLMSASHRELQYYIMIIYGIATILLFAMSTAYHLAEYLYRPHQRKLRYYLHLMDRSTIYFFIAASATPWLALRHCALLGKNLKWIVWVSAILGISYQFKFHERYKTLETVLYFIVSAIPYLGMITMSDRTGLPLMLLGGAVYAIGVVFFKLDGVVPFAHAIWHVHVLLGASIHTYAIYATLLGPDKYNPFPEVDFD
uniref:Uncharacterized protein n=1 Tax=Acrobeloides nanus TaxID=290746 RepID=A0A914DRB4_9BILA